MTDILRMLAGRSIKARICVWVWSAFVRRGKPQPVSSAELLTNLFDGEAKRDALVSSSSQEIRDNVAFHQEKQILMESARYWWVTYWTILATFFFSTAYRGGVVGLENVVDKKNTQVYQDRGLARPDCSRRRERTCLRYSYGWWRELEGMGKGKRKEKEEGEKK